MSRACFIYLLQHAGKILCTLHLCYTQKIVFVVSKYSVIYWEPGKKTAADFHLPSICQSTVNHLHRPLSACEGLRKKLSVMLILCSLSPPLSEKGRKNNNRSKCVDAVIPYRTPSVLSQGLSWMKRKKLWESYLNCDLWSHKLLSPLSCVFDRRWDTHTQIGQQRGCGGDQVKRR